MSESTKMKSKRHRLLWLLLPGLSVVAFFVFPDGSRPRDAGDSEDVVAGSGGSVVQNVPRQSDGSESGNAVADPGGSSQPGGLDALEASKRDEWISRWISERSSGATVIQGKKRDWPSKGVVEFEGKSIWLGETPPRYLFDLKADCGCVFFAELDDRKRSQRDAVFYASSGEGLTRGGYISVSIPWMARPGGFVLLKNESSVRRIGVIIPRLQFTGIGTPWDHHVSVRSSAGHRYVEVDDQDDLVRETINEDDYIVILGEAGKAASQMEEFVDSQTWAYKGEMKSKEKAIMWFEVNEAGELTRIDETEWPDEAD